MGSATELAATGLSGARSSRFALNPGCPTVLRSKCARTGQAPMRRPSCSTTVWCRLCGARETAGTATVLAATSGLLLSAAAFCCCHPLANCYFYRDYGLQALDAHQLAGQCDEYRDVSLRRTPASMAHVYRHEDAGSRTVVRKPGGKMRGHRGVLRLRAETDRLRRQ